MPSTPRAYGTQTLVASCDQWAPTSDQEAVLRRICDNDQFVRAVTDIATAYRFQRQVEDTAPAMAEVRVTLQDVADRARKLSIALAELPARARAWLGAERVSASKAAALLAELGAAAAAAARGADDAKRQGPVSPVAELEAACRIRSLFRLFDITFEPVTGYGARSPAADVLAMFLVPAVNEHGRRAQCLTRRAILKHIKTVCTQSPYKEGDIFR